MLKTSDKLQKVVVTQGGLIVEGKVKQTSVKSDGLNLKNSNEIRETTKHFIERLSDSDDELDKAEYDGFVLDFPQDYDP
tara:strand:+ start:1330 stop:1566 length:237 start_codon:yes stop_codon:yes gene_type:complete